MAVFLRATVAAFLLGFVDSQRTATAPRVNHWDYLGPFPISKNEFDGDPIGRGVLDGTVSPQSGPRVFFSELMESGRVGWTRLQNAGEKLLADVLPAAA